MKKYLSTIVLGALAAIFTILVKVIDVAPVGPLGSEVGFSSINGVVFNLFGSDLIWDDITNATMLLALASGIVFAVLGAYQLFKRKKLLKVDWDILSLGIIYVILGILYVLFEQIAANQRPILVDGELAASFPSSHVMLVVTVCVTVMMILPKYLKNQNLRRVIVAVLALLILVTIFGRLATGLHWLTDVIAGVIYGAVLISLYGNLRQIKLKGAKNE